jgi:2-dehydro-3-deoxygluconokinase
MKGRDVRKFLSVGEVMIEMSSDDKGRPVTWHMGVAGDTMNTASYARDALDDGWVVSYFTVLGADVYSSMICDAIMRRRLDVSFVCRMPGRRPGLYFIHNDNGDRRFTYWRDNSAARTLADNLDALKRAFAQADVLYFSGITLGILDKDKRDSFLTVVAEARRQGLVVAFDPNIRPELWPSSTELQHTLTAAARLSDTVLPTFGDEAQLFGDGDSEATARRYFDLGAAEVVVKDGSNATFVLNESGSFRLVPPAATGIVDTTGAGDSFNGSYLASRAMGCTPLEATKKAHCAAAICITHPGALAPV